MERFVACFNKHTITLGRTKREMQNTDTDTLDALAPSQKLAAQLRRDLHDLGAVPESRAVTSLGSAAAADGISEIDANVLAKVVVSTLIKCGDIGFGQSYGDKVLLKRRAVSVLYSGDKCVLLGGDPSQGEPHGLLRVTDEIPHDVVGFFDVTGQLSDADLSALWQVLEAGIWAMNVACSDVVTRLLCLAGGVPGNPVPQGASSWLSEHFPPPRKEGKAADPSQMTVIERPASARQIVTAGPGSGKTHTATERVIHLVREGIPPARIRLITFTRVAADEIGRRISEALSEHTYAAGVMCGTIDSMAWHLVTSLGEAPPGGHERIIRAAHKSMADVDQAMIDQLSRISHLVIDEAQDIVGDRRIFCRALIDALPASVGVTVLGDGAQAIYGSWAGDKGHGGSLHAELRGASGWENRELTANHRTRSTALQQFFREARALLEDGTDPRSAYFLLREMIEDVASDAHISLYGPVFPWKDDSLILFRGRAATIAASARLTRAARVHRMKLSGQTSVCDPLLGAICAGLAPNASVRLDHIRRRLADLHPQPLIATEEDILAKLQALGNVPEARLHDIGEMIDRQPVEYTRDYVGTAGPLLGSIHGAKGREASNVLLMLPPVPAGDDVDWQEEARVLFVGATRASLNLYLGRAQSGTVRDGRNGSRWLRGSDGGLLVSGVKGLRPLPGIAPALSVWEAAFQQPSCSFRRIAAEAGSPWHLVLASGEALAGVDSALAEDLDYLESTRGSLASGTMRVVGATTVVDCRSDGKINSVTLLPVLMGVVRGQGNKANDYDQ